MHSFCKRAFAAQDMCGCQPVGIDLGAQEDLCFGQGRLQGQWELEVGTQHSGVQEGLEHHSSHGLVLTPVRSSPNPKSESLSCSLSQSPCPAQSPVIQGALEAAETSPFFPQIPSIFSRYFFCTQIPYFNLKGKKHIQILSLFLALPECQLTGGTSSTVLGCAAGWRGLFLLVCTSISSVIL